MSLLFRPSEADREALTSTVRSLRETTVAGLAAALSWRTRKVERLLVEELTRPGTWMAYDPARRVVRWTPPVAVVWANPPSAAPAAPAPRPSVDLGPALSAPPPTVRSGALRAQCPSCHVALTVSASVSLNVCPQCGRLFSSRTAGAGGTATDAATAPVPAPATPASTGPTTTVYSDRKSQELLAAYVTSKPIPCPRCQTPLRHRGVSEYACPSCGETVRFGASSSPGGSGASARAPTAPRASSR
jgi:predicted RNA-binding Zn-ribbon protein involved in translation (DUF1610 family)